MERPELQRLQELLFERDLDYLARYILTKVELLEKELTWLKVASLILCTKITSATSGGDAKTEGAYEAADEDEVL